MKFLGLNREEIAAIHAFHATEELIKKGIVAGPISLTVKGNVLFWLTKWLCPPTGEEFLTAVDELFQPAPSAPEKGRKE